MENMQKALSSVCKLSHKQFRAILKKFRRKKVRQQLAKEKEQLEILEQKRRESSPNYNERQEEIRRNSELYEQFEEKERVRKHKLWLLREEQAQEEFKRKQRQLEIDKIKREEERKRILEEFERQEYVDKQAEEEVKKIKSQKEEALQEALSNLSEGDGPWHNPMAPENYKVGLEREQCMFFSKTGCCRFGERCSRGHTRPATSSTILIRGMYSHFSIDQTGRDDYDTDIALEYEDKECYQDFANFYNDVLPEFKKFGKVIQFKVCNNFEPHLRGNVYVQYTREQDAMEAYKSFNGRYYAGKQITCEFTHVIGWRSAICGLYGRNMCPKGINCNFLHVFKNPKDEFWEADRDLPPRQKYNMDSTRKKYAKDDRSYSERRHSSRSSRYESRSDRHESRNDRYEPRSDRYESRNNRYEERSEKYFSRSDRYESKSDRYDSKNDFKESYYSRYNSRSSDSSSCSSEENYSTKSKGNRKDNGNAASKHRKRLRSSSSRSRSNSPSDNSSQKKHSHKKKKHKKKKSKKSEKKESSDRSVE